MELALNAPFRQTRTDRHKACPNLIGEEAPNTIIKIDKSFNEAGANKAGLCRYMHAVDLHSAQTAPQVTDSISVLRV